MKALCLLFALAGASVGQEPPPDVPPPPVLRPLVLTFMEHHIPVNPRLFMRTPQMVAQAPGPRICSIPLRQFTPKGNYQMIVEKPTQQPPIPMVQGPAPPCEEAAR